MHDLGGKKVEVKPATPKGSGSLARAGSGTAAGSSRPGGSGLGSSGGGTGSGRPLPPFGGAGAGGPPLFGSPPSPYGAYGMYGFPPGELDVFRQRSAVIRTTPGLPGLLGCRRSFDVCAVPANQVNARRQETSAGLASACGCVFCVPTSSLNLAHALCRHDASRAVWHAAVRRHESHGRHGGHASALHDDAFNGQLPTRSSIWLPGRRHGRPRIFARRQRQPRRRRHAAQRLCSAADAAARRATRAAAAGATAVSSVSPGGGAAAFLHSFLPPLQLRAALP